MNTVLRSHWLQCLMAAAVAMPIMLTIGCGPWGKAEEPTLAPVVAAAPQQVEEPPADSAAIDSPAPVDTTAEGDSLQQRLEQIRMAVERFQTREHSAGNVDAPTASADGGDHDVPAVNATDSAGDVSANSAPDGAYATTAPAEDSATLGTVSIVSIRPAPSGAPAAEGTSGGTGAGGPAASRQSPTLDALVRHYQQLAEAHPLDTDVGRTLRVLQLMAGETAASLEPVPGLSAEDQRLWRGLVWAMANARDGGEGSSRTYQAAQVLAVLDELRTDLQRQAPLELPTVQVCQRVGGFGVITPLPSASVRPLDRVSLYTEVRNFLSQRERDEIYHVRLNQFLVLKDSAGRQVWRKEYLNIDDRCRTERQDFFLASTETIPADLAPGKYVLEVTVEDVLARKQAVATTELIISGAR